MMYNLVFKVSPLTINFTSQIYFAKYINEEIRGLWDPVLLLDSRLILGPLIFRSKFSSHTSLGLNPVSLFLFVIIFVWLSRWNRHQLAPHEQHQLQVCQT